ncbi:MAG: substrate-binding domain-containing protein [Cyclobacteriaceae bacterium]
MNTSTPLLLLLILFFACEGPPRQNMAGNRIMLNDSSFAITEVDPNEEYVMVTTATSLPLYASRDQVAFRAWGKYRGVRVSVVGPSDWNIPAQIKAIEEVIASRPAGMLINGTDPGIAAAINKAVEAGIPTIVYDSEVESKRHCFLGSDWYQMGYKQGEAVGTLAKGKKGKVAAVGILNLSNQQAGFTGLEDALKKFSNLEYIGEFETHNTIEETARITTDLINTYRDLVAVCGFTSETGPGIGLGLKEMDVAGKVYGTNVDASPVLMNLMKEGVLQYLVDQKRETFVWYGAEFVFDMAHNISAFQPKYLSTGVHALPHSVNTGLIEITPETVNEYVR